VQIQELVPANEHAHKIQVFL